MLVPFLRCRLFGRVLAQSDRPMCRLGPRRSGRGQPHPPCKSPGWRALLRPGAGEPPAAPHPPAPVCGGADAKTKPAVHGGHRQKRRPPRCGRTGAVRKLREKSTNPAFLFYSLPPDFATVSCAETAFGTVELQYILDKAFIGYGYGDLCEIYSSRKLE